MFDEIRGLEAQIKSTSIQLDLIKQELADARKLLEMGLMPKSRVLALNRTEADLIGRKGRLEAEVAKTRQSISKSDEQLQRLKATRLEEATKQLNELRLQRADLLERLKTAQDILDRVVVRAPVAGTVINLSKTGVGAVITPGEILMAIVPGNAELLVEARVRPQDIDEVHIGQSARLNFTALSQREFPAVPGEVAHVSADRIVDPKTGEVYYLTRMKISPDLPKGMDLSTIGPGQPVEVFITTRERTLIDYLIAPLKRTIDRSLRES
jgi:HlyD family secretion protein